MLEHFNLSANMNRDFLLVLDWFENFRLRHDLTAGREATVLFWKTEVIREGREREKWPVFAALRRGKLEVAF